MFIKENQNSVLTSANVEGYNKLVLLKGGLNEQN